MLLMGKRALITGSTSGIGKEIAVRFALEGAKVIVSGRDQERGLSVIKEIESRGGRAHFIKVDLRDFNEIKTFVARVIEKLGGLDILVNNAGVLYLNYIEDLTLDEWNETFTVNLTAPFLLIKMFTPYLRDGGVIINISSTAGVSGYPKGAAYCSSKAALLMLTKVAALELARYKIRVIAIAPGVINTPMIYQGISSDKLDEYKEVIKSRIPLGIIGEPIDIAELALFLASDKARFVTGSVFIVDGGLTAGRRESGISFER